MCFKNDAPPALRDLGKALGASLKEEIDAQQEEKAA